MPRIAEQALPVTGGVDTHADVHVARAAGRAVPRRGKLRPEIWAAWRTAHRG